MLIWILSLSSIYFTGITVSRYVKWRSWSVVRDTAYVTVLNLFGLWYVLNDEYALPAVFGMSIVVVLGLFTLYFTRLVITELRRTRRWSAVWQQGNKILFSLAFLMLLGPFLPAEGAAFWKWGVWLTFFVLFGLVSLWNMLWITFTKKDFPPFGPLANGVTLGVYVAALVVLFKQGFY